MRAVFTIGIVAALVAGGCSQDAPPAANDPAARADGLVARWAGGSLSLEDVENNVATANGPACREARGHAGGGSLDELVLCYEEIARDLVVESIVRAENPDIEATVLEGGSDDAVRIRLATYDRVYRERLVNEIEVSEAEIEAEYESDPERFRQPRLVHLMNIFRRHEDTSRPEATDAFLRELAARFEAGETWEDLAHRYSHSETRQRGGFVGTIGEGRLPKELEGVVFALAPGAVSEPVRVRGGSVIFHVRSASQGALQSLVEVRRFIEAELRQERIQTAIASYVDDEQPPEGSTILRADEVIAALDGPDPDTIVLEIGDGRVTVAQLRTAAGLGPLARASRLNSEERGKVQEIYTNTMDQLMLPHVVMQRSDAELTVEVEERLSDVGTRLMVNRIIVDELSERANSDTETLRTYWQDNQQHFLSPLRYRLRFWRLPFGDDPVGQLGEMEELRKRLAVGEIDLQAAVAELGGSIEDRDWVEHTVLTRQLPPKAFTYLAELGAEGYTVPYQQAESLHLIQLIDREEPRERTFDDAREDVLTSYVFRHRQELYRQLEVERLEAAEFLFNAAEVRESLTLPL